MKSTVAQGMSSALSSQVVPPSSPQDGVFQQWYGEGERLADAGAYDRALRCFEEAAILAPDQVTALVYQAVCLIHLGQPQQALEVAERILAIAPDHPQGWLYQGVALHRLGRYKEAYASYAQVKSS
ncbi:MULTISPECIES: tetratricopeptide repeat protein [Cyanophyceae]|uniref:tetratricopeptide repeat protein n=1 Tax=Cyanophyceae TaxID=3028117 RepID=UPI0016847020|nr:MULTISPECIES: tetratricopeptide repeat protein [Cyanophyceae]MBD1917149.1 tetratricopeptide repeat protein [Phormidium sp. FACHB-77]MBD2030680.1 tetratricopeptide repeat protein [Phormidium sp. FACHB-322]MBD2050212.1 tetratricopeptide repeat protein [Leptolyngbya sp. FACHB-60]